MIDYLIEIIFENVPIEKIGSLLIDLSSNGLNVVNYNLTCDSINICWDSERVIEKIFVENENFGLFINLKNLTKNGICLPNCGIAIYKNEKTINFELNFQLSDLKNMQIKNLTANLMKLANSIADQYKIENYFCGLEPAQGTEMRLFTKKQIGPIGEAFEKLFE